MNRTEWGKQFCFCFVCGYSTLDPQKLDTHEIVRGGRRKKALKEPSTWLRVCNGLANDCHAGKLDGMPVVDQLALKRRYDEEHYDRQRVNVLLDQMPDAITKAEVTNALRRLNRRSS